MGMSFEEFVGRRTATLLRTAVLLTRDRGHAEDLVQMTLWRTARRWDAARRDPDAYARRVLVNLSRDRVRGLRRRPIEAQECEIESGAEDPYRAFEERDTLVRAIRALPQRQREVVALRFFLDLSVAETAAALGCGEGAVKSYTARAMAALRQALDTPNVEVADVDR